jgi:hypothetical protein
MQHSGAKTIDAPYKRGRTLLKERMKPTPEFQENDKNARNPRLQLLSALSHMQITCMCV